MAMAPLFSLILLLLFFLPSSIPQGDLPQFWSIDCGGSESFTDYKKVTWVTDVGFVNSGENRILKNPAKDTPRELLTLREFKSTGTSTKEMKKHCYTIPVPKDTKVLAMVSFNYGNYDGRGIAPEFDVLYDGNLWAKVKTSVDGTRWIEIIYVTKRNFTRICLARTRPDQDPFVSSIEVRTLNSEMYIKDEVDSNKALFKIVRFAFGAKEIIRYPDDIYDRVWNPSTPEGYRFLTSNTTVVDTSNVTDSPPQAMLRSAIAPIKDSSNISFTVPDLPSAPVHVYYNMYFTEMTSDLAAENASRRSFMFYVDGQLFYSTEIVPEYGIAFQLYSLRNEASNNTKYDLQRAADASALPPIISGLEYYVVYDVNQFTLEEDVQALSALQEHFKVLQEWTGDPCLPEEYNWEWVVCAHFTTPRIITLNLSGYGLSGSLPDFSGLSFLKIIDLSNNSFTGDFPDFLAKLPELKYLNLADNDFGSIPISLRNNTTIELNISGNQLLKNVLSPPPSPTNGDINVEVAELLINIIVLFATIMVYHIYP